MQAGAACPCRWLGWHSAECVKPICMHDLIQEGASDGLSLMSLPDRPAPHFTRAVVALESCFLSSLCQAKAGAPSRQPASQTSHSLATFSCNMQRSATAPVALPSQMQHQGPCFFGCAQAPARPQTRTLLASGLYSQVYLLLVVQAAALLPLLAPMLLPLVSSRPSLWLCPWSCFLSLRPKRLLPRLLSLWSQRCDAPPGPAGASTGASSRPVGATTQRSLRSSRAPQVSWLHSCGLQIWSRLPLTGVLSSAGLCVAAAWLLDSSTPQIRC